MVEDEGRLSALPQRAVESLHNRSAETGSIEQSTAQIVELLADVPALCESTGRGVLVHYISEASGHPLMLPEAPHPKVLLYHLVLACREIPDGMRLLVGGVEFVAGQTTAVTRLRRLVSPVRDHLEPVMETQLEDLLAGLRVPSLARLYHAATGGDITHVPFRFTDAWDAFTALLDHNAAPDRPSPHLIFVAMLLRTMQAREAADAAAPEDAWRLKRLRDWLATQTEQLRRDGATAQADYLDRVRDRMPALEARPDKPIYLIIQLEPIHDLVDGQVMCRVSHWRQVHPLEWRPEPGDDRVVPLDEVPRHVGELIREAEEGWAYQLDDSLVLEFVLPMDMLNLDLEEWTRDLPDAPHPAPLGTEYEILIRSQERLRTLHMHRAWRQRWQVLIDGVECVTYWATAEDPAHLRRMGHRLLGSREIVACVLSGPPDREPGRSELWMALRAGIPVVLWHRTQEPPAEIRREVRRIVERRDLRGLPAEIKRLRATMPVADDRNRRADTQVALLWDDPHHFLDEADTLRAPG
jgi:hypothetical protein